MVALNSATEYGKLVLYGKKEAERYKI